MAVSYRQSAAGRQRLDHDSVHVLSGRSGSVSGEWASGQEKESHIVDDGAALLEIKRVDGWSRRAAYTYQHWPNQQTAAPRTFVLPIRLVPRGILDWTAVTGNCETVQWLGDQG